jgi:hypothetical protein
MTAGSDLVDVLRRHRGRFAPVLPFNLAEGELAVFDFSETNHDLEHLDLNDAAGFTEYLFERIVECDPPVGVGRYDEDRVLYRHSPLFDDRPERRSVHLGIDLFVPGGTPVASPLAARVHSLADNARLGDYGPTVILEHVLDGVTFFTLYGHLSRESLDELYDGLELAAGEEFARVGQHHENGGWPPHLHFQILSDVLGMRGDFPGVAAPSDRGRFLALCPDPNLILGISGL